MSTFRKVPVLDRTVLYRGGSTLSDPPNVIGTLDEGSYTALVQCAGEQYEDKHHNKNFWWLLIDSPLGRGWISAVQVKEGDNNEPIAHVHHAATVFEVFGADEPARSVKIVPGGGNLRFGGSTLGDQDNTMGKVDGGRSYPAFCQCAGEKVDEGPRNYWWVMVETPHGTGWVSAILVDEGGDDEPIARIPERPTVFATPPDLIP
jgi:hypothetical protein